MSRRIDYRWLFSTIAILIVLTSTSALAVQTDRVLSAEDALQMRFFRPYSTIAFSPTAHLLAYVVMAEQDMKSFDRARLFQTGVAFARTDIVLVDTDTGHARVLTRGRGANWSPGWSPDGHYLAFLSDRDGGQARVWMWTKSTDILKELSEIPIRGDQIEWTPDSQKLVITTLPTGFTVDSYARKVGGDLLGQGQNQRYQFEQAVMLYESKAVPLSGEQAGSDPWNLDLFLRDLREVDIATGRTVTIIGAQRIAAYQISPDGSEIAYTRALRFEKPGSQQTLFDFVTLKIATNQERVLAAGIRLDYDGAAFSWSPDSSKLSFHTGGMEERKFDCYVVDPGTGLVQNITAFPPSPRSRYKSSVPLWDLQGRFYFTKAGALWQASVADEKAVELTRIAGQEIRATISAAPGRMFMSDHDRSTVVVTSDSDKMHDSMYRVDVLTGNNQQVLGGQRCYTCTTQEQVAIASGDGQRILYFVEDAQHASDLWIADPQFSFSRQLTNLNPQFNQCAMGTTRLVNWLSLDGELLRGTLLLPANYREDRRYPLIVWVYGGASFSKSMDHFGVEGTGPFNMQLFASRGYAVFLPDAPQRLGTPMIDLAKTVLPGVNRIVDLGIADSDRVGVMGRSYGGYSTLSLLVQTRRFKAAVDVDGYGDLLSAYGQMGSDGTAFLQSTSEEGQGLMGGTPWAFRDRYIENSPIFYLDRVETPLLIIHGSNDDAVASFLGDEVFVALRRLGKQVIYAKYRGEGHDPTEWSYANQVDFSNRMIRWFDKYLTGDN